VGTFHSPNTQSLLLRSMWERPTVQHTIPTPSVEQLQFLLLRSTSSYSFSQTILTPGSTRPKRGIYTPRRTTVPPPLQWPSISGINTRGANALSQSQLRSSTNYNRSQPAAARINTLSPRITQPRIATIWQLSSQYTGTFPTHLTSRATDRRLSQLPPHIMQNPAVLFRATTHAVIV
jgi:hypothetical protein